MNNKAFDILTPEEKAALSLSINHSKSTWEAGEILSKAHYKYLEIHARAKHFFKIFTEYFKLTGDRIIPENSEISWDFREFIECTLIERMGYRETLKVIGKQSPLGHRVARVRDEKIFEYMEWLRIHPSKNHRALHDLIKEFDRWNNFRILPESLQEPSAFKRRNKTRLLKHLKNIYNLDSFLIDKLLKSKRFKPNKNSKTIYLPIASDLEDKGYGIIHINSSEAVLDYISNELNLYVFDNLEDADDYGHLVESYMSAKGSRTCKLGQKFWPKFRVIIEKAYNYNQVNNIIPRRVGLEKAFRDLDKIMVKRIEANEANLNMGDGQKRLPSGEFWKL